MFLEIGNIPDGLPTGVVVVIVLLWAVDKFILPTVLGLSKIKKQEFEECKKKLFELDEAVKEMQGERNALMIEKSRFEGYLKGLNTFLEEKGIKLDFDE